MSSFYNLSFLMINPFDTIATYPKGMRFARYALSKVLRLTSRPAETNEPKNRKKKHQLIKYSINQDKKFLAGSYNLIKQYDKHRTPIEDKRYHNGDRCSHLRKFGLAHLQLKKPTGQLPLCQLLSYRIPDLLIIAIYLWENDIQSRDSGNEEAGYVHLEMPNHTNQSRCPPRLTHLTEVGQPS